MHDEPSKCR